MPQLHCYVPEAVAMQVQKQAAKVGLSVSAYLAELVKHDVSTGWPDGYEAALFDAPATALAATPTLPLAEPQQLLLVPDSPADLPGVLR